jgi:hypothetical protein
MSPITVRTLRHEFRLHACAPALRDALRFMEIAPNLPDFTLKNVDIKIHEADGFCIVRMPNGRLVEGSPRYLTDALHQLIFTDIVESEPDAIFLHGATVLVQGKRVLLVGHKGCGKTTLTLHLLAHGFDIEGDEHLLVRQTDVVARPRTLRVKPGSLVLVPAIAEKAAQAPFVKDWDGTPIRAVSPAVAGANWTVHAGGLDAMIFLTANHGGRSVMDLLPVNQAFRRLMAEVVVWPANVSAAAGRLRALVGATLTGEMLLGDLASAEWHLRRFITS